MAKVRKKPVEVEAVQYEHPGPLSDELAEFLKTAEYFFIDNGLVIKTLEGNRMVYLGDWIIKGVIGEFYPCERDRFEVAYEFVED